MDKLDRYYVYIALSSKQRDVFFPAVCSEEALERQIMDTVSAWEVQQPNNLSPDSEVKLVVHHVYLSQKGIVLSHPTICKIAEAGLAFLYQYTHLSL